MKNALLKSFVLSLIFFITDVRAQLPATRSGFTWINTETVNDASYGAGYMLYSAAWPIFNEYPGPRDFQMGLAGCWLTTQRTGNEPQDFYTTIEGGLGWWHDTRFGTRIPKFIMGGVSHNFFAWANGPGAGRSDILPNGQRDWSTPGGKYGVAQLSNKLLWAPDGLNMAQGLNGEFLGYGYLPLPLTDTLTARNGVNITTGNQNWTLFLNATNFKGPATFFVPTFWTDPVVQDPTLEGLFLDSRPSDPNIGFGIEHAASPGLLASDGGYNLYAKMHPLQYPVSDENNSMLLSTISVYSHESFWNKMTAWFDGGTPVLPPSLHAERYAVDFTNNGGNMTAAIGNVSDDRNIELSYIDPLQLSANIMGYEYDVESVTVGDDNFIMPTYFRLLSDNRWHPVDEADVPTTTDLLSSDIPRSPRPETTYLTPKESDCQWQDPDGPWNNPGPAAGPFTAELGDGSTVTYYWYRFVDQPAIVHANLPEDMRTAMQSRAELIHSKWRHTDQYAAPPEVGQLATLDPNIIVEPPSGLEVGYVPIVTRQEKSERKLRIFVLAGQSNMVGYGTVEDAENDLGSLINIIEEDESGKWSHLGEASNWNETDGAYLYFANGTDTIRSKVTVGQGANDNHIGPELMFAHTLDEYYDDPVLIIKTAWGGKNLAEDFRPPSAGGTTGEYYHAILQTIQHVTQNISSQFPSIDVSEYELSGFAWFQGWNDGESENYLNEYENNLDHLVNDIRTDLNSPKLPFIIASAGQGGYNIDVNDAWVRSLQEIVSVAQENVGCNDTLYGGRLGFVDSKAFYIDENNSPENAIHHYNNNALTFLQIGEAIGDEMIQAINDMSFCYEVCNDQVSPGVVSIGNRVWNDLDRNGINEMDEPGIPGVSLVLWADSDNDGIPDWQGFGGVRVTDENGYYSFKGLEPGNYIVFVWSVNNWEPGQPLHGFQSTNGFVADADNDVDFDNNGFGDPFTDIMSGIVNLTLGEEPLNDGDPFNCYFDYDGSGNNTVDFGFFNPNMSSIEQINELQANIRMFPNPVRTELMIEGVKDQWTIELFDAIGRLHKQQYGVGQSCLIDLSTTSSGLYTLKIRDEAGQVVLVRMITKQ